MINLDKEFKTLLVLARAMMIMGAAMAVGGIVVGLVIGDDTPKKPRRSVYAPPEPIEPPAENTAHVDQIPPQPPATPESMKKSFFGYVGAIGFRTAGLGIVFIILGYILKRVIDNNYEDMSEEGDDQLIKAYADQLAVGEKQKKRKRIELPPT